MTDFQIYEKQLWQDHIVERPGNFREIQNTDGTVTHIPEEGEILQEGSPFSANRMNHIEEGIYLTSVQAKANRDDIIALAVQVAILRNAALNNFTNNIFIVNFSTLDSIDLQHGVYEELQKRLVI